LLWTSGLPFAAHDFFTAGFDFGAEDFCLRSFFFDAFVGTRGSRGFSVGDWLGGRFFDPIRRKLGESWPSGARSAGILSGVAVHVDSPERCSFRGLALLVFDASFSYHVCAAVISRTAI